MKSRVDQIVTFYQESQKLCKASLTDGSNQKPKYSLRTLTRALEYSEKICSLYGLERSLYEGFSMSFLTQLNAQSIPIMEKLIRTHIVKNLTKSQLKTLPNLSEQLKSKNVKFEHFWIEIGDKDPIRPEDYIKTNTVRKQLRSLARVVLSRKYPVLLQGPTSSGKTSMYIFIILFFKFINFDFNLIFNFILF